MYDRKGRLTVLEGQRVERPGLVTQSELEELRHWAAVGRVLALALVVGSLVYVVFNVGRLPW